MYEWANQSGNEKSKEIMKDQNAIKKPWGEVRTQAFQCTLISQHFIFPFIFSYGAQRDLSHPDRGDDVWWWSSFPHFYFSCTSCPCCHLPSELFIYPLFISLKWLLYFYMGDERDGWFFLYIEKSRLWWFHISSSTTPWRSMSFRLHLTGFSYIISCLFNFHWNAGDDDVVFSTSAFDCLWKKE